MCIYIYIHVFLYIYTYHGSEKQDADLHVERVVLHQQYVAGRRPQPHRGTGQSRDGLVDGQMKVNVEG